MGQVLRTAQAAEDVLQIWRYLALECRNVPAADRLVGRFEELLALLSDQPQIGTKLDRFRPGMRALATGNYVLLFEPIAEGVQLLRVVHGARRFEGLFD
jgi:toxin ParE1/3/4